MGFAFEEAINVSHSIIRQSYSCEKKLHTPPSELSLEFSEEPVFKPAPVMGLEHLPNLRLRSCIGNSHQNLVGKPIGVEAQRCFQSP